MKPFRISLKELIILIALSVPIGILLYLNNYNKFNYDTKVKRGFAISENFCENYVFNKISLLNTSDLDLISQKYKNRQLNSGSPLDGNMKILLRSDADTYDITFKGMVDPESRIYEEGNEILKYISALELTIFNNEYKSVKLHCKSGEYKVFKIQPMEKINIEFQSVRTYKKSYLWFFSILPFMILYLLVISFHYIFSISRRKD